MLKTIRLGILYAACIMAVGTLLFELIPAKLLSLFISGATQEEIGILMAIGIPAMRIIATHFIVAGVCICMGSVFQALGKGIYSMVTSICRQLVVLLPVALILAKIGLDRGTDNLVWLSFPIAEVACLVLNLFFFSHMKKTMISRIGDDGIIAEVHA